MILSLSVLRARGACDLDKRIESFAAHHGHPPDDFSTFAEWAATTPDVQDLIDALKYVRGGLRIAVEVAYQSAMRVIPEFESVHPMDERPRAALLVVRRWLDGEDVSQDLAVADAGSDAAVRSACRVAAGAIDGARTIAREGVDYSTTGFLVGWQLGAEARATEACRARAAAYAAALVIGAVAIAASDEVKAIGLSRGATGAAADASKADVGVQRADLLRLTAA